MLNTIITGDARVLSALIPDESIDLIFCDPPYLKENIEDNIYGWLAQEALRVLKPGGMCLVYSCTHWKFQAMQQMSQSLTYFWDYIIVYTGGQHRLAWGRRTLIYYVSLLAFVKGKTLPNQAVMDVYFSRERKADKQYHKWQQKEAAARYYLESFASPGMTVFDPFSGSATIPAICKQIGRNFIAFEIDPQQADKARKRLEAVQPLLIPEEVEQLKLA